MGLLFPKPTPRVVAKKRLKLADAKAERAAREIVRKRDHGKCGIPGCKEKAAHLHHIVYRSKSRSRRWDPANLTSLCVDHHGLVHAGVIRISGNADDELIIEGETNLLRFGL